MSSYLWGPEGPPPEAYSRVTDPERFAALHEFADKLLNRLEAEFAVERTEGYGLDPELESGELARPSVRLTPADADAAPILFNFYVFPSLTVSFCRWHRDKFPDCACDACDETAEGEAERLGLMVDDVIAGRFREEIVLPGDGEAREPGYGDAWGTRKFRSPSGESWDPFAGWPLLTHALWCEPNRRSRGGGRVNPARTKRLLAGSDRLLYEWKPWPVR
jgi:hypothetical protein